MGVGLTSAAHVHPSLRICRCPELCPHSRPRGLEGHVWREPWWSHLWLTLPDKGSHRSGPVSRWGNGAASLKKVVSTAERGCRDGLAPPAPPPSCCVGVTLAGSSSPLGWLREWKCCWEIGGWQRGGPGTFLEMHLLPGSSSGRTSLLPCSGCHDCPPRGLVALGSLLCRGQPAPRCEWPLQALL